MSLNFTTKTQKSHVPPEVLAFAEKIQTIHGATKVVREENGWHVYCASPICLERHGAIELTKQHLAINAEKHLFLGKNANRKGTKGYNSDMVALCMKTSQKYRVSELMKMKPIEQRGFSKYDRGTVAVIDTSRCLVPDGKGNMIPDGPGDTVPLWSLPPEHPARIYLALRNYRIEDLEAQFSAAFCVTEAPESSDKGRFYKRFAGGFRDTTQNRIIFFGHALGVRTIWQARYVELESDGYKFILHPYGNDLVPVSRKVDGKWQPMPGFDKEVFDPAKYKTAFGASRNSTVMGYDAALAWNQAHGRARGDAVVAICEGPLDAARLFPFGPAVAVLGKHMSHNQASLLCSHFRRFVLVGQNDAASQAEAMPKWVHALSEFTTNIQHYPVPPDVKDVGELEPARAGELFQPFLK